MPPVLKPVFVDQNNPAVKEYLEAFKKGVDKLSEKQKKMLLDSIVKDELENKNILNSVKNKSYVSSK